MESFRSQTVPTETPSQNSEAGTRQSFNTRLARLYAQEERAPHHFYDDDIDDLADFGHEKWIRYKLSYGILPVYQFQNQFKKDNDIVLPHHDPRQRYQPYQLFHVTAESLVKWEPCEHQYNHALGADAISLHIREWPDTPGLHQPNVCLGNRPEDRWNVRRALRRCGYWM